MPKKSKIERTELYKDRNTEAFLNRFLSSETKELIPVYDSKLGYRYPTVEAIVGDASKAKDFLHRLHEAGILERRLYDKSIYCPECNSANVSVHYSCPYCKSFNIHKSSLIEHVKCGYMDIEENFHKTGELICPKCNEKLQKLDVDYRKAGIWCTCRNCNKSFDIPDTVHFCRDCHVDSTFENAIIEDVYAYSLKEEVKEEVEVGWVIIAPIREFLQENGFKVESPAFLEGKSGANHMFDIAAYRGEIEKPIVIDLASSKEDVLPEQPVIALFAKIFDVSPDHAYLIAIPKMNENGKKMAELYNIKVVDARNQKEAIEALKENLLKKK